MNAYIINHGECLIEELEPGEKFILIMLAERDTWRYTQEFINTMIKEQRKLVFVGVKMHGGYESYAEYMDGDKHRGMSLGATVRRVV